VSEHESQTSVGEPLGDLDSAALLDRVAAAVTAIEQAKQERSSDEMRAARTHLAALHGVARLRRQAERKTQAA
jgi:hypothetical protein